MPKLHKLPVAARPARGISQNVECVSCKCRFNVSHMEGDHQMLVVTEKIPSEADGAGTWRTDLFPEILE